MDINWYGQSCFKIKGKSATVVIDPFDPNIIGLKLPKDLEAQVVLVSHPHPDHNFIEPVTGTPLVITGPGEYEKSGVSILGVESYHDSKKGQERGKNTIYQILLDNVSIVHLGDLGHILSEEQLSQIDNTDIVMVPTGGNYTIDAEAAAKVVSQLEPRIVIPMHYALPGLKVDLAGLEPFLKEMGVENNQPVSKLSITRDKLPDEMQVVVLSKS